MNDRDITTRWVLNFDAETSSAIINLVNCAISDGGTLGYVEPMTETEARSFMGGLSRGVESGETHVLFGCVGGAPAFLALLTVNGMSNCRHRAELSKGVVHPSFRGRRLVELGFRELVERAEHLGIDQLVLDVREDSRAHILWQRFGFASYGVLEDYARVRGVICRGHFMVQTVASLRKHLWPTLSYSHEYKEISNA